MNLQQNTVKHSGAKIKIC